MPTFEITARRPVTVPGTYGGYMRIETGRKFLVEIPYGHYTPFNSIEAKAATVAQLRDRFGFDFSDRPNALNSYFNWKQI